MSKVYRLKARCPLCTQLVRANILASSEDEADAAFWEAFSRKHGEGKCVRKPKSKDKTK